MTYLKTIIPSTGTETAPQSSGDPLANIPAFLRRAPKPAEPADASKAMCSTPGQELER